MSKYFPVGCDYRRLGRWISAHPCEREHPRAGGEVAIIIAGRLGAGSPTRAAVCGLGLRPPAACSLPTAHAR